MLKLADNLSLPVDFITERIAFLARTGAGKSGGMRVIFEAILDAKQFAIFIDPKGDAWGVRAAGSGKGYPVLVMGGDHADVPLQANAGKYTAEFLVKERVPVVLDISDFGKADMVRFVTDFAKTLYHRNRDVVHVFLDEGDMVAGEKYFDPHCLEAIQLIQNKGRGRGFGMTVATQRSAMLNKSVLFASGTLVAMQTTGPRDIKAVKEWLEVSGTPEATAEIIKALPTLKPREAFVYSPQSLGPAPVRITFKAFRTFDSMRTPRPGEARQVPKSLADINLATVQRDMAQAIKEAEANDPAKLRAKIADLERIVYKSAKGVQPAVPPDQKALEREYARGQADRDKQLQPAIKERDRIIATLTGKANKARGAVLQVAEMLAVNGEATPKIDVQKSSANYSKSYTAPTPVKELRAVSARKSAHSASAGDGSDLGKCERAVLTALYWLRNEDATPAKVAFYSDYSAASSTFTNALGRLRHGLVEGWRITADGIAMVESWQVRDKPTGAELADWLRAKLGQAERKLLDVLIAGFPNRLSNDEIASNSGYSEASSTFTNALGKLRTLEAAEGYEKHGGTKAADVFFE